MYGHLPDAYLWTVSDVDALKRWSFELRGIPGRLTIVEIVRLEYADNGIDVRSTLIPCTLYDCIDVGTRNICHTSETRDIRSDELK